jgi:hypothetical protein
MFITKLSLYLKIPKSEILRIFSYDELLDYVAYNNISGFLDKFDYQIALLTTILFNANSKKEDQKSVEEFLFDNLITKKIIPKENILDKAILINTIFGGTDERRDK